VNNSLTTIDQVSAASRARLPATYEAARRAIAKCEKIDECQSWANKAEAMASYAKQSKDETLRQMADRIQARAIRRCGKLLKQVEPQQGGDRRSKGGRPPVDSRKAVAESAGLSDHQRKTALRLASIPEPAFNRQVENPNPPTITNLAKRGRQKRPRPQRDERPDTVVATRALRSFAKYCENTDPVRVGGAMSPKVRDDFDRQISAIDRWLDSFVESLPKSTSPLD
jgi:hypothetical protein